MDDVTRRRMAERLSNFIDPFHVDGHPQAMVDPFVSDADRQSLLERRHGRMETAQPDWRREFSSWLASKMGGAADLPSDEQRRFIDGITGNGRVGVVDVLPGVGSAASLADAGEYARAGNSIKAAASTAFAALPYVPFSRAANWFRTRDMRSTYPNAAHAYDSPGEGLFGGNRKGFAERIKDPHFEDNLPAIEERWAIRNQSSPTHAAIVPKNEEVVLRPREEIYGSGLHKDAGGYSDVSRAKNWESNRWYGQEFKDRFGKPSETAHSGDYTNKDMTSRAFGVTGTKSAYDDWSRPNHNHEIVMDDLAAQMDATNQWRKDVLHRYHYGQSTEEQAIAEALRRFDQKPPLGTPPPDKVVARRVGAPWKTPGINEYEASIPAPPAPSDIRSLYGYGAAGGSLAFDHMRERDAARRMGPHMVDDVELDQLLRWGGK